MAVSAKTTPTTPMIGRMQKSRYITKRAPPSPVNVTRVPIAPAGAYPAAAGAAYGLYPGCCAPGGAYPGGGAPYPGGGWPYPGAGCPYPGCGGAPYPGGGCGYPGCGA